MALTNEFYRTLHILEMNYGSITNVPDDNEDVVRLHKMTQVIDPTRRTTALKLLEQGYTRYQISQETGLPVSLIAQIRKYNHLPIAPIFNYRIDNIYIQNAHKAADYFQLGTYHSAINHLRRFGHHIDNYEFIWSDIPIGGKYMGSSGKIYTKYSDDIRTYSH